MKILFVVPYVPNLVRVRPYNLIRHLARLGHSVTVATLYTNDQEKADLDPLESVVDQVIALPLPSWRSMMNVAGALAGRGPLQAAYCWNPKLTRILSKRLADPSHFDVVHIEHLRGAQYGLALRKQAREYNIPVIWDSVDNITYLFKQSSVQSRRWINRWITRFELSRTAWYEAWLVDQFDRILVTSPNDRKAFIDLRASQNGHERIHVLPNGVDLEYFTPDPHTSRHAATLVVSGKMSYHANITMVLALIQEIMPLIWQKRPEVRLQIVGKDPPSQIQALAEDSRVEVTGTVPDIRPYLRHATIAVAPVPYGAGIQNKVMEAMACATPVVTSSQAISALTAVPDQEILVADEPAEFAQKVTDLLQDQPFRERIGQAGLQYVQRCHDWNAIASNLTDIYRSVVKNA